MQNIPTMTMRGLGSFVLVSLSFASAIETTYPKPCTKYAPQVSKLSSCSTASSFCSSFLQSIGSSVYYTKTFTNATTTVPHSTTTITLTNYHTTTSYLNSTEVTTTVNPTTTTIQSSCPPTNRLQIRSNEKSSSCGIPPVVSQSSIYGACNCILASSTTATKTITQGGSQTKTVTLSTLRSTTVTHQETSTKTITASNVATATACRVCPDVARDIVGNGNFESGSLSPWSGSSRVLQQGREDVLRIVSPGAFGRSTYAVNMTGFSTYIPSCNCYDSPTMVQNLTACPDQDYLLEFSYLAYSSGANSGLSIFAYSYYDDISYSEYDNDLFVGWRSGSSTNTFGQTLGVWNTKAFSIHNTGSSPFALELSFFPNTSIFLDDISVKAINWPSLPPNGDFESGSLDPWLPQDFNLYATPVRLISPGHSGNYAALMSVNPSGDGNNFISLRSYFGLNALSNYNLTFSYLRYSSQTTDAYLVIFLQYRGGGLNKQISFSGQADSAGGMADAWNTVSYTFTTTYPIHSFKTLPMSVGFDLHVPQGYSFSVALDDIKVLPA